MPTVTIIVAAVALAVIIAEFYIVFCRQNERRIFEKLNGYNEKGE